MKASGGLRTDFAAGVGMKWHG